MSGKGEMTEENRRALVDYRLQRAKETLGDADAMAERGSWLAAINRLYYACYYAAVALLLHNHLKTRTHEGVKHQLGMNFVLKGQLSRDMGKFYSQLFNDRMSGDYDDFSSCDESTVLDSRPKAELFIAECERLVKEWPS